MHPTSSWGPNLSAASLPSQAPVAQCISAEEDDSDRATRRAESMRPKVDGELVSVAELLKDTDTLETLYELVRGVAGGLCLIFAGFTVYQISRADVPASGLVMAIDQVVVLAFGLTFWLMLKRRIPLVWVHALPAWVGLLVSANAAISVLIQQEGSDLRYLQAAVVGGGAIILSQRWLLALIIGTAALAVLAAVAVCSPDELMDLVVMQTATSVLAVVLCHSRIRNQRRLLGLREQARRTEAEMRRALARAEYEFAEHMQSDRERRRLEDELRQSQKLEALGTLAGGVAHDMNNVLGAITAVASTALRTLPPEAPGRQAIGEMLGAARSGAALTHNILSFARRKPTKAERFAFDQAVSNVESLLRHSLPKRIVLEVTCEAPECWIEGDSGQLDNMLLNLCLNAADAIQGQGILRVVTRLVVLDPERARWLSVDPGPHVELSVTDDGRGIDGETLRRVFDPYFSTKAHHEHSGLGLSMVYGTVRRHRGGIAIRSAEGCGTTVTVVFPLCTAPSLRPAPRRWVPVPTSDRNVVLFVDDEPTLRRAGQRLVKSLGFDVLLARDGREAVTLFEAHRPSIAAVVLDVAMPVMNGEDCLRALRAIDPDLPIVLASGFAQGHDIEALLGDPSTQYVRKPYELDSLANALAAVCPQHLSLTPVPLPI